MTNDKGQFGQFRLQLYWMAFREDLKAKIRAEMSAAVQARAVGNEGKARVCARRAAGQAITAYRQHLQPGQTISGSAYDMLVWLQSQPLPASLQQALQALLMRVDEQYQLPPDIDLLDSANELIHYLEDQV